MSKTYKIFVPWSVIIMLIIAGVVLFNTFNQPANIIGNEYITMTTVTFDDGDFEVHLEILEPTNVQIDGWASWVKFEDGSDSSRTSNNYPGVFMYTVPNIYPQSLTVFLEVAGHDTIHNSYFLDRFFITKNHQPVDLIVVEVETSEVETEVVTTSQVNTPINLLFSLLAIPILIKKRKHDD